jgi:hypothetical protein
MSDQTERTDEFMTSEATVVYVAGIGNSGPDHWQRQWHERRTPGIWVEHDSWETPVRDSWVEELDAAVADTAGPIALVAHSLGCLVVMEWALTTASSNATASNVANVVGAFLVSVPDPDGPEFPDDALGFGATAFAPLPFPAVVVASANDPYGTITYQEQTAGILDAAFIEVGTLGHINSKSGLGTWDSGWQIFVREMRSVGSDVTNDLDVINDATTRRL